MNWRELPERSNRFWILLFIRITQMLGRPIARMLLYPITLHFLLVNNQVKVASTSYLTRVLGRKPRFRDYFAQFHCFANVLLDRLAVLTENTSPVNIEFRGLENLEGARKQGRGAVLVGSHLGSIDILRTSTLSIRGYPVKAIMYGQATPTLLEILISINPRLHEELILIPGPSALISLAPEIETGTMIGLLGDRLMPGERAISCPFLGETAKFPLTPALISEILNVPLVQCFCILKENGGYEVTFETISNGREGPRSERERRVDAITRRYVRNLEIQTRRSPYNWFNFHEFWSIDDPI